MKFFLKSILSQITDTAAEESNQASEAITNLNKRIELLEAEIASMKKSQVDLAKCTQQIAISISDVAKELGGVMLYVYELEGLSDSRASIDELPSAQIDRKFFN